MLARERHRAILRRVHDTGGVRVTDLARHLRVAEETIRRDLEKLDGEGKLVRTHGGAVPVEADREIPFALRETENLSAKRLIARVALKHIAAGDVIALDASSTASELARLLPDLPLTVITNSLMVGMALGNRAQVRVISTGGLLDGPSRSFVGSVAEAALERFNIGKLFFSCKGLDLARGLSVAADEHARMKRRMLDLAEQSYLLADHSKFGVKSAVFFARAGEVNRLITDRATDAGILAELGGLGVQTERAE